MHNNNAQRSHVPKWTRLHYGNLAFGTTKQ
jgi:hypothetical protein